MTFKFAQPPEATASRFAAEVTLYRAALQLESTLPDDVSEEEERLERALHGTTFDVARRLLEFASPTLADFTVKVSIFFERCGDIIIEPAEFDAIIADLRQLQENQK